MKGVLFSKQCSALCNITPFETLQFAAFYDRQKLRIDMHVQIRGEFQLVGCVGCCPLSGSASVGMLGHALQYTPACRNSEAELLR